MPFYQVMQKHERVLVTCCTFMSEFLGARNTFMSEYMRLASFL